LSAGTWKKLVTAAGERRRSRATRQKGVLSGGLLPYERSILEEGEGLLLWATGGEKCGSFVFSKKRASRSSDGEREWKKKGQGKALITLQRTPLHHARGKRKDGGRKRPPRKEFSLRRGQKWEKRESRPPGKKKLEPALLSN